MSIVRRIFNNKDLITFLAKTAVTTKIGTLNKEDTLLQEGLYIAARYIQERPLSPRRFRLPVRLPPAISLSTA